MTRWFRDALIVGVAVAAALTIVSRCYDARESEWESRVRAVSAVARENLTRAREAEAEADSLRSQAAEIAAEAEARVPVTDSILVTLPPPVTPAERQRDVVIERLMNERDLFREALALERDASAKLQSALDLALERGDSLRAVLDDRPSNRPWWIPRLGVGPALGTHEGLHVDPITVHVTWEVRL